MNPSRHGLFFSMLALAAYGFTLSATALGDSYQPKVQLIAVEQQEGTEQACPYPPDTPAAAGAEAAPPVIILQRPVRSPLRPAIYMELSIPADQVVPVRYRI